MDERDDHDACVLCGTYLGYLEENIGIRIPRWASFELVWLPPPPKNLSSVLIY